MLSGAVSVVLDGQLRVLPFLIIGEHLLIGLVQIPAELPDLIVKYLAAGDVDYSTVVGPSDLAPTDAPLGEKQALPTATHSLVEPASTKEQSISNGFTLTIAILIGMLTALIYTLISIL